LPNDENRDGEEVALAAESRVDLLADAVSGTRFKAARSPSRSVVLKAGRSPELASIIAMSTS
jgi:hypothetical protein